MSVYLLITHRKVQKLGLETIYKQDSDFRKYCGMIDSLAFLSLNKVLDGMQTCLKENIPPYAEDLLFYFYFYKVNGTGTYRRVGMALSLCLRKIPSIFLSSTWNNYTERWTSHQQ